MDKKKRSLSEFQMALLKFRSNRLAMLSFWVVVLLYTLSIFADFISPYSYRNENRDYSYCPPVTIRIFNEDRKLTRLFIYYVHFFFY